MKLLSKLNELDLEGQKVFLRLDLNVPVNNGIIIDRERISRVRPTVEFLHKHKAQIIIASHFGRPEGKIRFDLSLEFLADELSKEFNCEVVFNDISLLKHGKIVLLENLRFDKREEENSAELGKELAALADIYVNDAFSCSHRAHASISAITEFLPAYAGLLLEEEVSCLENALKTTECSTVIIVAGKKVSTKFAMLKFLVNKAEHLVIGGAMANTFLKALGHEIGKSYYENDFLSQASEFYNIHKDKIFLPSDVVVEQNDGSIKNCSLEEIYPDDVIYDVGSKSVSEINDIVSKSKVVLWNGPLGFYEDPRFLKATQCVAKNISELTQKQTLISVAGGGDVIAALELCQMKNAFTYISTAGGAFLEYLEGKSLPGLLALRS